MTAQQARFSAFLQGVAAVMFGIACGVRIAANGLDALAALFGLVAVIAFVAALLLRRKAAELQQ